MNIEVFVFYAFAALAILASFFVVTLKNTARALFLFFVVLFAMAGLYLFALADFVAITQIMVYVGGVLILMIFAFMLSNKELLTDIQHISGKFISIPNWQAAVLAVGFAAVLLYTFISWQEHPAAWIDMAIKNGTVVKAADNNVHALGFRFMTYYLLPFEVISIFLMAALIGASHLARKEQNS